MSGEYKTLRSLLEHHVQTMRLRPEAPWPKQCEDTKEMIKSWQRAQQHVTLKVVKGYGPDDRDDGDWNSGDSAGPSVVGA